MATTARSKKADHVLDDARQVLSVARRQLKEFAAADKGKKRARIDAALLKRLADNIAATDKARDGQRGAASRQEGATAVEIKARVSLHEALIAIRDDVATTHDAERAVARAFGVGARLRAASTPGLLSAAGAVLDHVREPTLARAAAEAGITRARLASLAKLRDALAAAQSDQVSAIASRKTGTMAKDSILRAVEKDVAYIRRVAAAVFRAQPELRAEFASVRPRRRVQKVAPKSVQPTPTP